MKRRPCSPCRNSCRKGEGTVADHAVVIGIESYPGLSDLEGPSNDASAFYDWLVSPAGGNLDPVNVRKSLTTDFGPQEDDVNAIRPQLDDLHCLFDDLLEPAVNAEHIGDRLFLYAAGHGIADSQEMNDVAVMSANARPMMPLHITLTLYAQWFRRSSAFDEVILIMDCCRDVNVMISLVPPTLVQLPPRARAGRVKTFYAFATEWAHVAKEREIDGVKRGIFTTALLDALKKQKPNRRGRVTGSLIARYIRDKITIFAGDKEIRPPQIDAPEDRDVLFVHRDVAPTVDVAFIANAARIGKEFVVFDGQLNEVHRIQLAAEKFTIPLHAGYHSWTIVGSDQLAPFEVPTDEAIAI
jgi:hypothetical protein